MDYCTKCGRPAKGGMLFCTGCGARLQTPTATAATAATATTTDDRGRREPAGAGRPGPPRWALLLGIVLLLGICGAVATIIVMRTSNNNHLRLSSNSTPSQSAPAQSTAPQTTTPQTTTPQTTTPQTTPAQQPTTPPEQVAAQGLASLLAKSASDRSSIVNAVSDVNQCGSSLSNDIQVFQQAASSRQQLLSQLASLRDSSALPAQVITDLRGAWQASQQADQDFAAWASDENNSCTPNDSSNANFQAATGPDNQASADKTAFVSQWNPIATQYNLSTYKEDEL